MFLQNSIEIYFSILIQGYKDKLLPLKSKKNMLGTMYIIYLFMSELILEVKVGKTKCKTSEVPKVL